MRCEIKPLTPVQALGHLMRAGMSRLTEHIFHLVPSASFAFAVASFTCLPLLYVFASYPRFSLFCSPLLLALASFARLRLTFACVGLRSPSVLVYPFGSDGDAWSKKKTVGMVESASAASAPDHYFIKLVKSEFYAFAYFYRCYLQYRW